MFVFFIDTPKLNSSFNSPQALKVKLVFFTVMLSKDWDIFLEYWKLFTKIHCRHVWINLKQLFVQWVAKRFHVDRVLIILPPHRQPRPVGLMLWRPFRHTSHSALTYNKRIFNKAASVFDFYFSTRKNVFFYIFFVRSREKPCTLKPLST